jgi:hypothetical protein
VDKALLQELCNDIMDEVMDSGKASLMECQMFPSKNTSSSSKKKKKKPNRNSC